jgi:two-component system, OmpR family, alkaline phosphatase synthesis response regulator PhoP
MLRVLVIDDEPDVLLLCRVNLRHAGHDVTETQDGAEGLSLARETTPDVVVLDLMLPRMDGYQVLEALREDPATKDLPVVVLTAKAQLAEHTRSLESGAVGFLTKPFAPEDLVRWIEALAAMSLDERDRHRLAELRDLGG